MTKPVVVLGAGGHSKVIIEALRLCDASILGIADKGTKTTDDFFSNFTMLDDASLADNYKPDDIDLVIGVGSLPGYSLRAKLYKRFSDLGYQFRSVVHPSAIVAQNARLLPGTQVMAGSIIQPSTVIGANSIINTGASVDHDCIIGANCHISPGAILSGNVKLGSNVHIGAGASVIQSLVIEEDAVVGAGAVVTTNIARGNVVYPAKSVIKEGKPDES